MNDKVSHFIPGVGWRYDTEHSMLRRLGGHDYKGRSIYMITITLADRRKPLLGTLIKNGAGEATVALSPLGERVKDCWERISLFYPGVRSLALQIMPEHLHGVLFITEAQHAYLGQIIKGFKIGCSRAWWELQPELLGPAASAPRPSSCAPNYNSANGTANGTVPGLARSKGAKGPSLFSSGYQDSVLTGRGQLETMISYVSDNPRRAMVKRENPNLFRVVRDLVVGSRRYSAIGNQWLLNMPMRLQVRCHNNTSPENLRLIARQKAFFLARGREGAVVVSPCISPGEREIARAALDAHQPLVVILENGFPALYKPPGRYFEACADGSLLMLAPWPYHTERRTITRQQCIALNEMAAAISTDPWTPEDEWRISRL